VIFIDISKGVELDVLLTDGDYKHTYTAVRALHEKNLKVGVICSSFNNITFFSRFVEKRFFIKTDINKNVDSKTYEEYKNALIDILKKNKVSVLLPIGNSSCKLVSEYKDEIEKYTSTPIVDKKIMRIAQDKNKTFKFAEKIGISIPITFYLKNRKDVQKILREINYPCVIKKTNMGESGVVYCNNRQELVSGLEKIFSKKKKNESLPLIQEYVRGSGVGFYALFEKGKCRAYFMHERIHEYPITGGASSLAKSSYSEELKKIGVKLLKKLKWHGVVMIEFKKNEINGGYKLMEINPKFWGSLELSLKSGINFPYLAYLLALNKKLPKTSYKKNVYFRWLLPYDILWLRFSSKDQKEEFKKLENKVKIFENIYPDDFMINLYNIFFTFYKLLIEKRYPHGRVEE
jgi:predicted ATP-grasp superfamily ATP-dependent carboligase